MQQLQGANDLSRSSVYRLLLSRGLSRPIGTSQPKELRRFEADYPGDIIYGDVMHGPCYVPHYFREDVPAYFDRNTLIYSIL